MDKDLEYCETPRSSGERRNSWSGTPTRRRVRPSLERGASLPRDEDVVYQPRNERNLWDSKALLEEILRSSSGTLSSLSTSQEACRQLDDNLVEQAEAVKEGKKMTTRLFGSIRFMDGLIVLAFMFFLSVVVYIIYKRL